MSTHVQNCTPKPRYAVAIGELYLAANRPTTEADRERISEWFKNRANAPYLFCADGLEVTVELKKNDRSS